MGVAIANGDESLALQRRCLSVAVVAQQTGEPSRRRVQAWAGPLLIATNRSPIGGDDRPAATASACRYTPLAALDTALQADTKSGLDTVKPNCCSISRTPISVTKRLSSVSGNSTPVVQSRSAMML